MAEIKNGYCREAQLNEELLKSFTITILKTASLAKMYARLAVFILIEGNVSLIHRNDLSGTAVEFQRAVKFNGQDGDVLVELLLWHIDIDDARHFAP